MSDFFLFFLPSGTRYTCLPDGLLSYTYLKLEFQLDVGNVRTISNNLRDLLYLPIQKQVKA